MSKPTTSYSSPSKVSTTYTGDLFASIVTEDGNFITDEDFDELMADGVLGFTFTGYASSTKQSTSFTGESKDTTNYITNTLIGAITLDSMTVTLDSGTVRLTGYTGTVPDTESKPKTSYT
jgi:hypothetical protein